MHDDLKQPGCVRVLTDALAAQPLPEAVQTCAYLGKLCKLVSMDALLTEETISDLSAAFARPGFTAEVLQSAPAAILPIVTTLLRAGADATVPAADESTVASGLMPVAAAVADQLSGSQLACAAAVDSLRAACSILTAVAQQACTEEPGANGEVALATAVRLANCIMDINNIQQHAAGSLSSSCSWPHGTIIKRLLSDIMQVFSASPALTMYASGHVHHCLIGQFLCNNPQSCLKPMYNPCSMICLLLQVISGLTTCSQVCAGQPPEHSCSRLAGGLAEDVAECAVHLVDFLLRNSVDFSTAALSDTQAALLAAAGKVQRAAARHLMERFGSLWKVASCKLLGTARPDTAAEACTISQLASVATIYSVFAARKLVSAADILELCWQSMADMSAFLRWASMQLVGLNPEAPAAADVTTLAGHVLTTVRNQLTFLCSMAVAMLSTFSTVPSHVLSCTRQVRQQCIDAGVVEAMADYFRLADSDGCYCAPGSMLSLASVASEAMKMLAAACAAVPQDGTCSSATCVALADAALIVLHIVQLVVAAPPAGYTHQQLNQHCTDNCNAASQALLTVVCAADSATQEMVGRLEPMRHLIGLLRSILDASLTETIRCPLDFVLTACRTLLPLAAADRAAWLAAASDWAAVKPLLLLIQPPHQSVVRPLVRRLDAVTAVPRRAARSMPTLSLTRTAADAENAAQELLVGFSTVFAGDTKVDLSVPWYLPRATLPAMLCHCL